MQVTVYGASGKVGRLVVAELLAANYTVVAFIHRHNPFAGQDNIRVVSGSIDDSRAVAAALVGSHAVISTLGSWGTPTKTVVSSGTATIIAAASQHQIRRLITLTGSNALYASDRPTLIDKLTHTFIRLLAPKILRDGEEHLKLLVDSPLDWTTIRSPVMVKFGSTSYKLTSRLPSLLASIPRRAVASALVEQLTDTIHLKQAPVIRRG